MAREKEMTSDVQHEILFYTLRTFYEGDVLSFPSKISFTVNDTKSCCFLACIAVFSSVSVFDEQGLGGIAVGT